MLPNAAFGGFALYLVSRSTSYTIGSCYAPAVGVNTSVAEKLLKLLVMYVFWKTFARGVLGNAGAAKSNCFLVCVGVF